MNDPRHQQTDAPDAYDRWLFVRTKALARVTAVEDLAQVYAALGVLTVEDALGVIRELQAGKRGESV